MDHCKEIFEGFLDIHDPECLKLMSRSGVVRRYKKGAVIASFGEMQKEIPFIISGSFWCYFTDPSGRRIADCVLDEAGWPVTPVSTPEDFFKPLDVCIATLEKSDAYCIPTEVIVEAISKYEEVRAAMGRLITTSLGYHRKLQLFTGITVAERYKLFCNLFPGLPERLTLTSIAAILNTNPSTLSRVLSGKQ